MKREQKAVQSNLFIS